MSSNSSSGFTLVELLLVVVILGMLMSIAVPSLIKSKDAANTIAATANLREIHNNQSIYRFQNNRYGRLSEIDTISGGSTGKLVGSTLQRNDFIFIMLPTPTNASLRSSYQVVAYRVKNGRIMSQYQIAEDGLIKTILP